MNTFFRELYNVVADSGLIQTLLALVLAYVVLSIKACNKFLLTLLVKKLRVLKDHINVPHYPTSDSVDKSETAKSELKRIKVLSGATRAAILQFHNGESFSLNNPIFKFSYAHELVKQGHTYEDLKNVFVSQMLDLIGPLLKTPKAKLEGVSVITGPGQNGSKLNNPPIYKYELEKMEYSAFVCHAESIGTVACYACILKSPTRKTPMGALLLQYDDTDGIDERILSVVDEINGGIGRIEFTLD